MPLLPISVQKAKDDSIFANDRNEEELKTLVDNINVLYVAFTRAKHNLLIFTGNKMGENTQLKADGDTIDSAQTLLLKAMPKYMETHDHEDVITTYQCGAIIPTQADKASKQAGTLEADNTPLPVSFTSYPTVATFRQSYASDLFITADSSNPTTHQHAKRIRLISLGNLYHNLLQHIHTVSDVPRAVQLLASKGCFGTLLDATEAQTFITQLINDITPQHPEWFSPDWQVISERTILHQDNHTMTISRPDRVVVNGHRAIIIDYKTAQGTVTRKADGTLMAPGENIQQIQAYKKLLSQMDYTDIQAYLWYILDNIIIPV